MNAVAAYIEFVPGLIDENGEVSNPATAEFLKDYMEEFHTFVARVLTVLPRES